jgi:hypothetical protein
MPALLPAQSSEASDAEALAATVDVNPLCPAVGFYKNTDKKTYGDGMQQEHNHVGDPTYVAYSLGCRHGHCLAAFNEYKLRLAWRKLSGEYRDLRLRENKLRAEASAMASKVAVMPREGAGSQPAEGEGVPVAEALSDCPDPSDHPQDAQPLKTGSSATEHPDDVRLLVILRHFGAASGVVPEQVVSMLAPLVKLSPERCEQVLGELEAAGHIHRQANTIYLGPAAPEPAEPAAPPKLSAPEPSRPARYSATYDPATGRVRVGY